MLNMQYVAEALAALRPGIGFNCVNNDLSTLICENGVSPTESEILAKIQELHPS